MTGIILLSKRSHFTIHISIKFTFISLKVVGYMRTTLLERLSNNHLLCFIYYYVLLSSLCFWLVQSLSCPTLCDPMNCCMPGLPAHHQLPEFTQTHVHRVGDTIQPSHPLSSPSPPAPNPSQHQSLFQ